jgi:predicted GNAT family N-acyltransferase
MLELKIINGEKDLNEALAIRAKVFIEEQKVPPELEWDDKDKIATHFILYLDQKPIGTARVFLEDNNWYIGRMAVLKEYRGKGYGKFIMQEIMKFLSAKKPNKIIINAQIAVLGFYRKFGFVEVGEEFWDAGIKHKAMVYPF